MKRLRSLVLGLFALCSMVGMAQEAEADDTGYIVKVGQVAPDFTVTLTDGRTVTLSDFRGKVVMLQFTASWYVWEWDCLSLRLPTECNRDILSYEKALFAICGEGFLFLWLLYFFFLAYLPRLAFGASGSLCSLMISLHASRFKSCGIMSFGIL